MTASRSTRQCRATLLDGAVTVRRGCKARGWGHAAKGGGGLRTVACEHMSDGEPRAYPGKGVRAEGAACAIAQRLVSRRKHWADWAGLREAAGDTRSEEL